MRYLSPDAVVVKVTAEAGATVCVGTWPPALNIFLNLIERGKMDESRRLSDGSLLTFEKIYPLDAVFDTYDAIPEELRTSKRYKDVGDFSVEGLATRQRHEIDIGQLGSGDEAWSVRITRRHLCAEPARGARATRRSRGPGH